jgi:hypothetical protein
MLSSRFASAALLLLASVPAFGQQDASEYRRPFLRCAAVFQLMSRIAPDPSHRPVYKDFVSLMYTLSADTGPSMGQPNVREIARRELALESARLDLEGANARGSQEAMDRLVKSIMAEDATCKELASKAGQEYVNSGSGNK